MLRNIAIFCFFLLATSFCLAEDLVLLDASRLDLDRLTPQTAKLSVRDGSLCVETEARGAWPGFYLGKQNWNFSHCDQIEFDMTNSSDKAITLHCRLDSPDVDFGTMAGTYTQSFALEAGESKKASIVLPPLVPSQLQAKFFAMRGFPGGASGQGNVGKVSPFHKDAVVAMTLFLNSPDRETRWSVKKIVAVAGEKSRQAEWMKMSPEEFFPMIDKFGQFKYEDWPGKIQSEADMATCIEIENKSMEKNPGPANWSRYGGDAEGLKLKATGHFRVEKVDETWWFVDPDGYLFWSHGVDCVGTGNGTTPITDREFYFEGLPPKDDAAFKNCYGKGSWAPHNYYEGRGVYETFNFTQANLVRKYGNDWFDKHAESVHKRLKSWGMNTIANWSDGNVYKARKTPYTATFGSGGRPIEGSGGYWGKFPDPFSGEFESMVERNAKSEGERSGKDPWCLGWFVDNEISWGNERSLAIGAITSPADQPAKIAFVEDLKKKYGEIEKLNTAWGSAHADWNALIQSKDKPDENKAGKDLDEFHRKICDKYFMTIRDAIKKYAPDKLYLGCRFAWSNETAIRVSANYCDVISFNKYERSLAGFRLPEGIDKPVVIGEFHFGALDRGMFHTGLVPVESQAKRAEAYEAYVRSALEHPQIVGTHWFQYGDQATTGRGDGENYQIGLVNICDVPYPETVAALRKVGYRLYEIRSSKSNR